MPPSFDGDKTEIRISEQEDGYPRLELTSGPSGGGGHYLLKPGKNSIGRALENDIALEDSSISRRHASIDINDQGAVLSDLASRNGTKVGDRKIEGPMTLEHGTSIQIGLFKLRYLTQPAGAEMVGGSPPLSQTAPDLPVEPVAREEEIPELQEPEEPRSIPQASKSPRWLLYLFLGSFLVVVLVMGGPQAVKFFGGKKVSSAKKILPQKEGPKVVEQVLPAEVKATSSQPEGTQPVFLEFSSSPIPAQVFFGDQLMGVTPFRTSLNLGTGRWYEAKAVFQLPELGETLEEKSKFNIPEGASVIPVNFSGKVGIFKVGSLPRDAQLYLEGYFEKDPYRAKPIKFSEIAFGKPVYVPFGRYILELRKNKQLGSSQTFLDEVVYRREFNLTQDQGSYAVDVSDETLQSFPVQLTSLPSGAKVFVDQKEVGTTPYNGVFPIGEHLLTMKHEGYFDYVQPIKMAMNMPYMAEIPLKTSAAGELINKADLFMKEDRYAEALPVLVEAFSKNPSSRETAQISYMIGLSYLKQKSLKEARDYFTKAAAHEDYKNAANLGLANVTYEEGDRMKALQMLVGVLVASDDPRVRSNAGVLFQKISPLKSVVYITSDPPGARVFINGPEMTEATPLIIHDMGVGTYSIKIRKEGYEESEIKLNLAVSEFRPLVVKLHRIEASLSAETQTVK